MDQSADLEYRMCKQKLNLYGACIKAFEGRQSSHPGGMVWSPVRTASLWQLVGQGRSYDVYLPGQLGNWIREIWNGFKKKKKKRQTGVLADRPEHVIYKGCPPFIQAQDCQICLPVLTHKPVHPEFVKFSDLTVCVLNMFSLWTTILCYMDWWSPGLT